MSLDDKYKNKLEKVSFQPVFILGFHRSGTSILYKILSETKCFNPVTAYHIIKYDELIHNFYNKKEKEVKKSFNDFLKNIGQTDRGIDRLKLSADFNEEYRFIFTNNFFKPEINSKNVKLFKDFCKKIQLISENKKPILLKNPYDFSNFLFIKKVFPQAKFILLHRKPVKVVNSNMKSMIDLFKKKNYYTAIIADEYKRVVDNPLSFNIVKFYYSQLTFLKCILITNVTFKAMQQFLKDIPMLDQTSYTYIRYEDLCENPKKEITKIMNFLNLKSEAKIDYSKLINPRKSKLLNEVQILQSYINKKMKEYLDHCGYSNEKN